MCPAKSGLPYHVVAQCTIAWGRADPAKHLETDLCFYDSLYDLWWFYRHASLTRLHMPDKTVCAHQKGNLV